MTRWRNPSWAGGAPGAELPFRLGRAALSLARPRLFGAGSAVGFSLVLVLFAGIRERIEGADVPLYFKGVAIAMVTAGLMSLAFMGFAGMVAIE